jgi:hypothetical protein
MNFNFGEVLSRAWQIIWKHKVLWLFGILASCTQGGRGFNSGSGGGGNGTPGTTDIPPQLERILNTIAQNATAFIAIAVGLVCVIWLLAIFLGTVGKIGLIRGAWQAEGGAQKLVFGQLFSESTDYFWRIFGLSLIVGLPFVLLLGGLAAALIAFGVAASQGSDASAVGFVGILPVTIACICLLIPIGIVVSMIIRQAERVIVLENAPVLASLSRGWDIFRSHLGEIILMAIILGVIGLVAGFIIAIPVFIVVVPAILAFMAGNGENWSPLIAAGVLLCLYIPISWLLNGILISYAETAWTLTYMRLTGRSNRTDGLTAENGTPPSLDDGNQTVISSSHA